ncbi:MAG: DUF4142 domain-containing protein [Catalinimonas sp.]
MKKLILTFGVTLALVMSACSDKKETTTDATEVTAPEAMDEDVAEFFEKASLSGMFTAQAAQLAQDMATNPEVKNLAAKLMSDHDQANQKLMTMARTMNVQLPQMSQNYQDKLDELRNAGADFDKKYLEMVEETHKASLRHYEEAADETENAELKTFVQQTMTTMRGHEEMVERLKEQMGA